MYEEGFVEHDFWFLNTHAFRYYEDCDNSVSPIYDRQIENISHLFDLVPLELRSKLRWAGPGPVDLESAATKWFKKSAVNEFDPDAG